MFKEDYFSLVAFSDLYYCTSVLKLLSRFFLLLLLLKTPSVFGSCGDTEVRQVFVLFHFCFSLQDSLKCVMTGKLPKCILLRDPEKKNLCFM